MAKLSHFQIEGSCIATNYGSSMLHLQVTALVRHHAELVEQVKEHLAAAGKVTSAQTAASLPSASGLTTTGSLRKDPAVLLVLHTFCHLSCLSS